jgi:hypothetical protein
MIIDRCRPLNEGESETVRVVMSVEEAQELLARGGRLTDRECATLRQAAGPSDRQRSRGVVERVAVANDRSTIYLMCDFDNVGYTGFGGLVFDAEGRAAFEREVAAIFGVEALEQCVGKECWGLWCRGQLNEVMEGLETPRGRVTLSGFTAAHYPRSPRRHRDARRAARESLEGTVAWAARRRIEAEAELRDLDAGFVDWASAPPSTFESGVL